jgi:hypothetical protein
VRPDQSSADPDLAVHNAEGDGANVTKVNLPVGIASWHVSLAHMPSTYLGEAGLSRDPYLENA